MPILQFCHVLRKMQKKILSLNGGMTITTFMVFNVQITTDANGGNFTLSAALSNANADYECPGWLGGKICVYNGLTCTMMATCTTTCYCGC